MNRIMVIKGLKIDNNYRRNPSEFRLCENELKIMFAKRLTKADCISLRKTFFQNYTNEEILQLCFLNINKVKNMNMDTIMEYIVLKGCVETMEYIFKYSEYKKRFIFDLK